MEKIKHKITEITSARFVYFPRTQENKLEALIRVYDEDMKFLHKHKLEVFCKSKPMLGHHKLNMGEDLKKLYIEYKKEIGAI